MTRAATAFFVTALLGFGVPTDAAETPMVGEVFLCTFHDGKGWGDLNVAIDVYNAAVAEAGAEPINEYVWRPLRSQVDFDFLWAAYSPNMNVWGRNLANYFKSAAGGIADAMFESMIDCDSAMVFVESLYDSDRLQGASRDPRNPNAIESYVCSLKEGKTEADLQAAIGVWHDYVTKLGLPIDVYRRNPLIGVDADTYVSFFAVHPNVETFAANTTAYTTGSGFGAVQQALNDVQTCRSSLWTSWQVSPPVD